jgi:organic radical activating enzyme
MIDNEKESLFLSDDLLFYTLEGEGEYIGKPSVFMRLSMCNLTCKGFASADSPHGCDSYISWSIKNKMTFNEIFTLMDTNKYTDKLKAGAILKITGGEPLIQQKQLLKFINAFNKHFGFIPVIDFETNATLLPDDEWKTYNATFTTSPKLTSNGDEESKTYKPDVLKWHVKNKSGFKFVISKSEDIDEIWRKYIVDNVDINIPLKRVWFMPCCGSREEHIKNAPAVAEYAKALNVNFSPRLHLLLWDKALKV